MNRTRLALAAMAALLSAPVGARAREPVVGERRVSFLDDVAIERMQHVRLRAWQPAAPYRAARPAPPLALVTVLRDPRTHVYRMYGRAEGEPGAAVCVEGPDGVNWPGAPKALDLPAGARANFAPLLDANPKAPAAERYKALAGGKALRAFGSPDGVTWRALGDGAAIASDTPAFDCANRALWDPLRRQYVAYVGERRDGRRVISRCTSKDFLTWTRPGPIGGALPGEQLAPGWFAVREDDSTPYVALAVRVAPSGSGDVVLLSSRDGEDFGRAFPDAMVRPHGPGPWPDWRRMSPWYVQPVSRGLHTYTFMGEGALYAGGDRCCLHPAGRLSSAAAGAAEGELVTAPLTVSANVLHMDFATGAAGWVKVEVLTPDGKPIEPYTLENAVRKTNDRHHIAEWKDHNRVELVGRRVRLRFVLKDADLYSFQFSARK